MTLRAWAMLVALGAAVSLISRTADAAPPTIERAVRDACGDGALQVAGPWDNADAHVWAGLVWNTGSPYACLVLVRATRTSVTVDARGRIPAGYSSHEDVYFAPRLRDEPLRVEGQLPAPITDATDASHGDRTIVWLARNGRWSAAWDAMLNAQSDVHTDVRDRAQCPPLPPVEVRASEGHAELRARSCFDGRFYRIRARFDGRRFIP